MRCVDGPDDPTALGVSAAQLAEHVAGAYELTVQALKRVPEGVQVLGARMLTVNVETTTEPVPGLDDCAAVEAPVRVRVRSGDPMIDQSLLAVVSGTPARAMIDLAPPQLGRSAAPLTGGVSFVEGRLDWLQFGTDDLAWRFEESAP